MTIDQAVNEIIDSLDLGDPNCVRCGGSGAVDDFDFRPIKVDCSCAIENALIIYDQLTETIERI